MNCTKEEWEARWEEDVLTWYIEANGKEIAIIRSGAKDEDGEKQANAYLIAAAPRMYKALRNDKGLQESLWEILAYCRANIKDNPNLLESIDNGIAQVKAQAQLTNEALANAEGELNAKEMSQTEFEKWLQTHR